MNRFQLERQIIEELRETKVMLNECELEYDALMGFVQENNLEDKLDQYLYAKVKNCDNEEEMEAYLRLITNEHEPEPNVSKQVFDQKPFFFVNGQPVDFSKIMG